MRKVTVLEVNGLKLKGAYGRQTNMEDWQSGKDFKIEGGPYCSIKDLPDMAKEFDVLEFVLLNGDELYTEIISEDLLYLMNGEGA
jgi:hypothetical protein